MEYDDKLKQRLKRAEGQIRGVLKMMEEEEECRDVLTQLSAARSALDKATAVIVATNLEECVRRQTEEGEDTSETIEEAVNMLVKSR
ncbi:DNA-binding FrmR family transcriptional regulator [Salsuginibacillus halophilus]|uniref:DNA-binding FrmR family transcriptional regulator n=1 Tax=Salsuginibacillus halophilus TaxID=517424 RepID=A0A2P8HLH6_9BACI|nr:metal-sensitive transcriptional regulator [Salsuginibacillus halophilus]PSL47078.1 DNA-binding FrmR family transcriptional regulator [Salsuginibacillus halophilus]